MINVTIGESKTQEEKPFPKLMKLKQDGSIVFFVREGYGLPLLNNAKDDFWSPITVTATGWDMHSFTDYNEPITLQNA